MQRIFLLLCCTGSGKKMYMVGVAIVKYGHIYMVSTLLHVGHEPPGSKLYFIDILDIECFSISQNLYFLTRKVNQLYWQWSRTRLILFCVLLADHEHH